MIEPKVRQQHYRDQNRGRMYSLPYGWNVDKSSFSPRQRRRLIKKYRRHATVVAAHANDPDVPLS
jgi:hypothetical protein